MKTVFVQSLPVVCLGSLLAATMWGGWQTVIQPAIATNLATDPVLDNPMDHAMLSIPATNHDILEPDAPTAIAQTPTTPDNMLESIDTQLLNANLQFSFDIFNSVQQQDARENLMISPNSVAFALSMLYNGAAGETQQAIADTLNLQGMSIENINQSNATLMSVLESADPQVQLAIANSLWARQGVEFLPDFLQQNQQYYEAEVTTLDFSDPNSLATINNWVAEQTENRIPTILDSINPMATLYLINAIYFNGNWAQEFDADATQDRTFYPLAGEERLHPTMSQRGEYHYLETEEFQAISLPYGDNRLSMYVFLPTGDLTEFYGQLTAENWTDWMSQFSSRDGSIQLPRFQAEYDVSLENLLADLGMAIAFDASQADFSALSNESMVVSEVKHKTFINVNEEGTEAAAVTSVSVRATSVAIGDPPFNMTVDRPFFYAIHDNQTGTLLFMGQIVDPNDAEN